MARLSIFILVLAVVIAVVSAGGPGGPGGPHGPHGPPPKPVAKAPPKPAAHKPAPKPAAKAPGFKAWLHKAGTQLKAWGAKEAPKVATFVENQAKSLLSHHGGAGGPGGR